MRRAAGCCLFLVVAGAHAQETITVTATREPRAGFDVPAAIDAVGAAAIREDNPQVNLSETLNRVPGIVVSNRQNFAQDLQVTSRGFGGRATFGVRGVRLIADGIPATMPDGQGQAATFDLASAQRIEVLRGPFASLYGNASGGVVQVFTADGPSPPALDVAGYFGSDAMRKWNLRAGGDSGGLNYLANVSRFSTDGYRDHSAARRDQGNAKLRVAVGPGTLTFIANALEQRDAQDPLGLTRAQFEADPRQADAAATQFDTRKSTRQAQAGVVYEARLSSVDRVSARIYGGDRQIEQFLGQGGDLPLGSGGVVDLDRTYGGVGLRWTRDFGAASVSVGADHDRMKERRRGFVNLAGVAGRIKRDEDDRVTNNDVYLQAELTLASRWVLAGGVRRSSVRFSSQDYYVEGPNPDDSGGLTHARTTPVAGVLYKASPALHLYANAGEGFETPTFAELAYRPGGATGLNFDLRPARSRHYEAGAKARLPAGMRGALAVFRIETRDEIVTNASAGGRTDFRNAGRTRRDGVELSLEGRWAGGFEAYAAYTALDARFLDAFAAGAAEVASGRKLPGVPSAVLYAEALWRHASGLHAGVELRRSAKVYVNDANTDAAAGYTVANVRAGMERGWGAWRLRGFARVDNVAGRSYAGSVIVAEARSRFFEPAPRRTWTAGLDASFNF